MENERKTVVRGFDKEDERNFGEKAIPKLTKAGQEILYLMNRGYEPKAASTFVGNHYMLSERQRLALTRMISTNEMIGIRKEKEVHETPPYLNIDGFNLIILLEVAFSNSLILEGLDGCYRDLCGLRGTYKIIDKTEQAIIAIMEYLSEHNMPRTCFYLDKPVSNSGRLRSLILEYAEKYRLPVEVEVIYDVDRTLYDKKNVVTGDAIILNQCHSWFNLGKHIIDNIFPVVNKMKLDLL